MQKRLFTFILLSIVNNFSTFIDNRFFPFFPEMYKRSYEKRSVVDPYFFMMIAHDAYSNDDKDVEVFDIFGKYNLTFIGESLAATGRENPVLPEWQTFSELLSYDMQSKLNAQGIWLGTEFALIKKCSNTLSLGSRFAFMRVNSSQRFIPSEQLTKDLRLSEGGLVQLDQERREASCLLGIESEQWSTFGITDIDFYLRFGHMSDYIYKCRFFDMGLSLGTLVPVGTERDINNSASVPFSSDGFWGLYALGDFTTEFKEDWYFGVWFDGLYRFKKNKTLRLPYNKEPDEFGAIVGDFKVQPGFTLGGGIFFKIFDFNNGLGGALKLQGVKHWQNKIYDCRVDKTYEVQDWDTVLNRTSWMYEYFSVELMYDIAQAACFEKINMYFYLNFDAPVHLFNSYNVSKTYKLSLGLEVDF